MINITDTDGYELFASKLWQIRCTIYLSFIFLQQSMISLISFIVSIYFPIFENISWHSLKFNHTRTTSRKINL